MTDASLPAMAAEPIPMLAEEQELRDLMERVMDAPLGTLRDGIAQTGERLATLKAMVEGAVNTQKVLGGLLDHIQRDLAGLREQVEETVREGLEAGDTRVARSLTAIEALCTALNRAIADVAGATGVRIDQLQAEVARTQDMLADMGVVVQRTETATAALQADLVAVRADISADLESFLAARCDSLGAQIQQHVDKTVAAAHAANRRRFNWLIGLAFLQSLVLAACMLLATGVVG